MTAESKKKTQSQRREETQAALLQSARKVFAQKGYADTSLDDIVADCGLTTRPVYHYFGSKKALFETIAIELEEQLADEIRNYVEQPTMDSLAQAWRVFLETCKDDAFRQIVLVDAPNFLGRQRWQESTVVKMAESLLISHLPTSSKPQSQLIIRMILVALAEAAIMIGETDDTNAFIDAANQLADDALKLLAG